MTPEKSPEYRFRKMVVDMGMQDDVWEREILVSPYYGAYGLAGVVIAINGSPPRGTILAPLNYGNDPVVWFDGGKSRTYREQFSGRSLEHDHGRHWVVKSFLESIGVTGREPASSFDWPIEIKGG